MEGSGGKQVAARRRGVVGVDITGADGTGKEVKGERRGKERMRKPDQMAALRCIGWLRCDRPNYWAGMPAPNTVPKIIRA